MAFQSQIQVNEDTIRGVYEWVDGFNLSKAKKNISRDFSDGCLVAEIIHQHFPHMIELHNYYNTTNLKTKKSNWELLKRKAFKKMNFFPSDALIDEVVECGYLAIETFLISLQDCLQKSSMQKSVLRLNEKRTLTNPDKGTSKERKIVKSNEDKVSITQHISEINEMKKMVDRMKLTMNQLQAESRSKEERIKFLENRLFENGIRY